MRLLHNPSIPNSVRRFISDGELETLTGIKRGTWQKKRARGEGPRFYRIGGSIRYDLAEVLRWIEAGSCDQEGR